MQSSQQEVATVPANTTPQSNSMTIFPGKVVQTPVIITSADLSPQHASAPVIQDRTVPAQRRISRRTVVVGLGLVGLAVSGGGIAWLASSQGLLSPHASNQTPTAIPTGTTLYTYRGHSGYVSAVAWSPDGKRIASGSNDKTVEVWDAADGANVYTYGGHSSYVLAVAWSPDGKRIASGSDDKMVQVWEAG